MSKVRILPLVAVGFVMILYIVGDGERFVEPRLYLSYFDSRPAISTILFVLAFTIFIALSLPVTGVLAVVSGMIFGVAVGTVVALLAGSMGASCSFLISRYALRDVVQRRFAAHLEVVNRGVEKDGVYYLASMRMIAIIPFGLLNLLMALTPMRVSYFFGATLLGMTPPTLVMTYFGSQLVEIQSFKFEEIFTPSLILSLGLIAILPLLMRWLLK